MVSWVFGTHILLHTLWNYNNLQCLRFLGKYAQSIYMCKQAVQIQTLLLISTLVMLLPVVGLVKAWQLISLCKYCLN